MLAVLTLSIDRVIRNVDEMTLTVVQRIHSQLQMLILHTINLTCSYLHSLSEK